MDAKQISEAISQIGLMYDRQYSEPAKKALVRDLINEPAEAMIKAIRHLEQEFNTLPTPIVLTRIVREQSAIIREEQSRRDARAHREAQDALRKPDKQNTAIAAKTCLLVNALMEGKITRGEYLEGIRHLDNLYPAAGYAVEGARLKNFYEKKGLAIDRCVGELDWSKLS